MFIDINTLGPEGLAFDHVLHLHGLDGPSRERLDVVDLRLSGSVVPVEEAARADLSARLEASLPLQCSRCLERFVWPARARFDLTVVRAAREKADDDNDGDLEAEFVAPEGKLELEAVAIEQLYLNFPLKPICSPDCRGLCPTCGANRNLDPCSCGGEAVDPRFAPLLRLRSGKSQES